MTIYGYCRRSKDADGGSVSLPAQERTIRGQAYALGHDMDAVTFFTEEGVSGRIPLMDRPEGGRLYRAVQPGDTIIVAFFDRIFRDALDALQTLKYCQQNDVTLHIMDLGGDVLNSPFSKAIFTIIAALAQLRREEIAARTVWSKQDQKARGRYLGGAVPFGYRLVDGNLVEHEPEQAALREARKWKRSSNTLSNRQISAKLKELGFKVSHVTLGKIL